MQVGQNINGTALILVYIECSLDEVDAFVDNLD